MLAVENLIDKAIFYPFRSIPVKQRGEEANWEKQSVLKDLFQGHRHAFWKLWHLYQDSFYRCNEDVGGRDRADIEATLTPETLEHLSKLLRGLQYPLDAADEEKWTKLPASHPGYPVLATPSQLLIVDEDTSLAQALASEAASWGIETKIANNVPQARSAIARSRPDIVLLDLHFSDIPEAGFELLTELRDIQPSVPVIVLTERAGFAERVKVARLGGRGFFQKPMLPAQVIEAINRALPQSHPPVAEVLIVNDDPCTLETLEALLDPWGFKLTLLKNPYQFWDVLEQCNPDLLILDLELSELSSIDLCQVVRNDPYWKDLPLLLLSDRTDAQAVQKLFAAGADDYVQKPIVGPELVARVLNRLERVQMQRRQAETDSLTGIANRRKSMQELSRLLHLSETRKQPFSFMLLDLDCFKQINDSHGHDVGDRVLIRLSQLLKQHFCSEGTIGRWGGEEFVVGLYGATKQQGMTRLTAVLKDLTQQEFVNAKQERFQVSFSAGVAEYYQDGTDLQTLYQAADTALYSAKTSGRNRVLLAENSEWGTGQYLQDICTVEDKTNF